MDNLVASLVLLPLWPEGVMCSHSGEMAESQVGQEPSVMAITLAKATIATCVRPNMDVVRITSRQLLANGLVVACRTTYL